MSPESKCFQAEDAPLSLTNRRPHVLRGLVEVGLVFGLIIIVVWTPLGRLNTAVTVLAAGGILWLTLRGPYSAREAGLTQPMNGLPAILAAGMLAILAVAILGLLLRSLGSAHPVALERSWQYCIWAMLQEFILQSFFFLRLESALGARRAVFVAAGLFSLAHIPSPVLTIGGLVGGCLFCELFRRYRNIIPLGIVHAGLGLTIAAALPDSMLHHMRVGLGYLTHP